MSLINGNGAWDETFCCRSDQPALKRDLWWIAHTPAHTVHPTILFSPTGPSLASRWFHSSCTAEHPVSWAINQQGSLFTQISHSFSYFIQLFSHLNQTSFEFLLSAKSLVHLAIYSAPLDSKMYMRYALQINMFLLIFSDMFLHGLLHCINYELIEFYQEGSTSLNMYCVNNRKLEDKIFLLCGKALKWLKCSVFFVNWPNFHSLAVCVCAICGLND